MSKSKQDPDALYRRHECIKRLLGEPEQIDTQGSKLEEQDPVVAECDLAAQESLRFLDLAHLTGDEAFIRTAISLWNMAIDRRRHRATNPTDDGKEKTKKSRGINDASDYPV
jgi:hypothetical protein